MSRRASLDSVNYSVAAHTGLLLDVALGDHGAPELRRQLFEYAKSALTRVRDLYSLAFQRRDSILQRNCAVQDFRTSGRLVCGLGIESVLETGLRLHHTYGTPLIPGSSIKGVCAHYCAEAWASHDPTYAPEGEAYGTMFGNLQNKGLLTFEDAWIAPRAVANALVEDVMTPIRPKYYAGASAPTDCLQPIPLSFLSIRGTFRFYIRPENAEDARANAWTRHALELCRQALSAWGIGGKTRAGYGRMTTV